RVRWSAGKGGIDPPFVAGPVGGVTSCVVTGPAARHLHMRSVDDTSRIGARISCIPLFYLHRAPRAVTGPRAATRGTRLGVHRERGTTPESSQQRPAPAGPGTVGTPVRRRRPHPRGGVAGGMALVVAIEGGQRHDDRPANGTRARRPSRDNRE